MPYSSLETIVEATKEAYYRALRLTQATLKTETPNFIPWQTYFLRSLQKQIERLEFTLKRENITHLSLPKLAEQILQLVQKQQKVTISDILQATQVPRSTVKKYLGMLIDQKYLMRHGQGRNIWYTIV